jgi:anti-anti-sigma factor
MTETSLHSAAPWGDGVCATTNGGQLARLDTDWTKSSVVVVSAHGEIDTTNARMLTQHSLANLLHSHGLVLDLTRLDFFGASGFSELHRISVGCARSGKNWVLVPGAAVSLVLRVCDPDGLLPAVKTLSAALASVEASASAADISKRPLVSGEMG